MAQNTDKEPDVYTVRKQVHYRWTFNNIKPIKHEKYDLKFDDLVTKVMTAPSNFEMDGYLGNSDSWENFGLWIYSLNQGRNEIPPETKNELMALTKDSQDTREKIELIYNYMQTKTRYVNVVIGIGGWQPFHASDVDEDGYGDCKALTNYTCSLLNAVGIPSYYTIIRAGSEASDIKTNLPSNQFNHAILCVPDGNDTIWLECTSQRTPVGYMGTFTPILHGMGTNCITPGNSSFSTVLSRQINTTIFELI
ncbi:MAG: transglutaminase family protein [Bacteroidales bacterium]|nr:transglutaminase family protein [Bacteroidales bacterium]